MKFISDENMQQQKRKKSIHLSSQLAKNNDLIVCTVTIEGTVQERMTSNKLCHPVCSVFANQIITYFSQPNSSLFSFFWVSFFYSAQEKESSRNVGKCIFQMFEIAPRVIYWWM